MASRKGKPDDGDGKGDKPRPARVTTRAVQANEDKPVDLPAVEARPEVDDADELLPNGLTFRRALFAKHIAVGNSPTKAAELAGYAAENRNSLKSTASRLLTFVNVRQAIAREMATVADHIDDAKLRLVELSRADFNNFLSYDEHGKLKLDPEQAAELGALGQVKEWYEERIEVDGVPGVTVKRRIKVHDPRPAIETRLKLHGLLFERHHHSGTVQHVHRVMTGVLKDPEAFAAARLLTRRTTEIRNQEDGKVG